MAKVEIPIQVTIPIEDLVEYLKKDGTLVEVVRCKDCKWSYDAIGGTFCSYGCCVDCEVDIDFFCADGERRDPCS